MADLFASATRFVVIYAWDVPEDSPAQNVSIGAED